MKAFLDTLLQDFEYRAAQLLKQVQALDERARKELRGYILLSYTHLEEIRRLAGDIRSDPAFGEPAFIKNQIQLFRRLVERFSVIDWYLIPMIERFNEQDHKITALFRRFAQEAGWPLHLPVVTSFSNQYFWTKPDLYIIAVPSAEGRNFLAFPNICHELAHILILHYEKELLESALLKLDSLRQEGGVWAVEAAQAEGLHRIWRNAWIYEIAADMIAVYLIGAPYGWQHLRLRVSSHRPAFHPPTANENRHPDSRARMSAISVMLQKLGSLPQELQALWGTYQLAVNEEPVDQHDLLYPPDLIGDLAENVIAGCSQLGLRRFDQANGNPQTVAALVNAGWSLFLQDPRAYPAWERKTIKL